ncbi:caspase family protein [Paraburkholderia aspalathi]|uniref:caspase family protein n=1 Tax=Paraburkholderia aspalathi TaxID=1324617 RepID=UPI0038B9427E
MPSLPDSDAGRRFFIVAGTEEYLHLGESMGLPSVASDLERVGRYFASHGCERALPALDLNPELTDIRDQVPEWVQQNVKEDDIVAFYYSGHGTSDSRYYLPLRESKEGLFSTTAIPIQELTHWLIDGCAARQIVIIIDACYAGVGTSEIARIAEGLADTMAVNRSVFAIAAVGAQIAQEGEFSKALCDALENRDGELGWRTQRYIYAEALIDAVNERLKNAPYHQTARLTSATRESCKLFRNPFYQPSMPANLDLQLQRDVMEHWLPKARGAGIVGDSAWYFTGRKRALSEIVDWLEASGGDSRMRVVTGRPGVGKSALMGRLVTLSNPATRTDAIGDARHTDTLPPEGAVQVAIHARRRSLRSIVEQICSRMDIAASDHNTLLDRISERGRTVIAIDAVDEAIEPGTIIDSLLKPLSRLANVRLIVAMRPDSATGHVTVFGDDVVEIDLSASAYFDPDDILAYSRSRLGQPNARPDAIGLAPKIAAKAGNVFLIARILCDSVLLGSHADPVLLFDEATTIAGAFGQYLTHLEQTTKLGNGSATELLLPLAFAEGEGLPWESIWPALASALSGKRYEAADVHELLTQAGAYIVEGNHEGRSVFRLYHEALAEYLRGLVDRKDTQCKIVEALSATVPRADASATKDWQRAHPYLLRHLATHAADAGWLETLVRDTEFLLHAAPQTLAPPLRALPYDAADGRAVAYLRAYAQMQGASVLTRIQYLALSAALSHCGGLLRDLDTKKAACSWFPDTAWYRDTGSHVIASAAGFQCACFVHSRDGDVQLVLVSNDRIRILSLSTGEVIEQMEIDGEGASSAIEIPDTDDVIVALAYEKGEVVIVNVTRRVHFKTGATALTRSMCVIGNGDAVDRTLVTGDEHGMLTFRAIPHLTYKGQKQAHRAAITALASGTWRDGTPFLITGSDAYREGEVVESEQLRVWNGKTFELIQSFSGLSRGSAAEWCAHLELAGKPYIAAHFYPSCGLELHALGATQKAIVLDEFKGRPFGVLAEQDSAMLLSGYFDVFSCVRIVSERGRSPTMQATANLRVEGGKWLGPMSTGANPAVVSVGNDVRVWDLARLCDRATASIEERVGMLDTSGEPLFALSAPRNSRYFGGLSRYGNLRVWSDNGGCVVLRQLVTSLEGPETNDFDYFQLIDYGDRCMYAVAGRSGAVRAWYVDGEPVGQDWKIDANFTTAFHLHAERSGRLLAMFAVMDDARNYSIAVWNLLERREVTASGRFQIEGYEDKTINHLVAIEDDGKVFVIGALKNPYYSRVCMWDLDEPAVAPDVQERRERYGLPHRPRVTRWMRRASQQIECLSTVQFQNVHAIAIGDAQGWITVLRASDGHQLAIYRGHDEAVVDVATTKIGDRDIVVSAGKEGRIAVCDLLDVSNGRDHRMSIDVGDRIYALTVVSGDLVAVATDQGYLTFRINLAAFDRERSASRDG